MTAILERSPDQIERALQADPVTLVVMNERAMLFVRPEGSEAWQLPAGIINPDTFALEACCSTLRDKAGATVQVLGAHSKDDDKQPLQHPIAVAEIAHWEARPACKKGEERTKWVRFADGNFSIDEEGMVFSSGTADVLESTLEMVRRKKSLNASEALKKIARAIRRNEVATQSAA